MIFGKKRKSWTIFGFQCCAITIIYHLIVESSQEDKNLDPCEKLKLSWKTFQFETGEPIILIEPHKSFTTAIISTHLTEKILRDHLNSAESESRTGDNSIMIDHLSPPLR